MEQNKKAEEYKLEEICKKVKISGKLTGKDIKELYNVFNKRFIKAFEALRSIRVKKYIFKPSGKKVWIVIGKEREYLIIPEVEFCSCKDFYFRVLDMEIHLCYHLIAQKLAEILDWYGKLEENDDLYETLMNEWEKVNT
jgi:predicted nucleic acid-binding Zn finger protein